LRNKFWKYRVKDGYNQDQEKISMYQIVADHPTTLGMAIDTVFYGSDVRYVGAKADADFVAHAPEDIAFLLDEIKKRDELIRELKEENLNDSRNSMGIYRSR
jgi:hypothetical protein